MECKGAYALIVIDPVRDQSQMCKPHGLHRTAYAADVGPVLGIAQDDFDAVQIAGIVHADILSHIAGFANVDYH